MFFHRGLGLAWLGSFYWLLVVWRASYLIHVSDLVWYYSICFGKEAFFWQQEPLASSAINYYRLSLHPKAKPIKSAITRLCTKLGMCTFDSVKRYLNITDTMYISWDLGTKSVCALQ